MPKSELHDPIAQQMQKLARRDWIIFAFLGIALALSGMVISGVVVPNAERSKRAVKTSDKALRLIKGDTGPKGPTGDVGPTGAPGPAGPQGAAGPKGLQGLPGPAGVRGKQGGTGLIGERGPTGVDGPRGPEGPKGAQGDPGVGGPTGPPGPQGPEGPQGPVGPIPDLTGKTLQCEPNPDPNLPGTYVCKFKEAK